MANNISNSKILNTVTVDASNVPDELWIDIKESIGIFNEGDMDFFIWTEEMSVLSKATADFINKILDEHQGIEVDIISFR
jgi:hypothetical protein